MMMRCPAGMKACQTTLSLALQFTDTSRAHTVNYCRRVEVSVREGGYVYCVYWSVSGCIGVQVGVWGCESGRVWDGVGVSGSVGV